MVDGYYDREAARYDESRGGVERARGAADAVAALVPHVGRTLDVAGGTGIVSDELAAQGRDVLVVDLSVGMLRVAALRLPGRVTAGSADRLPVVDASCDLVTVIWLLHLLPTEQADAVLTEAARVLRPGGHLVTTVDKHRAHGRDGGDSDERGRVLDVARRAGLAPAGETSFSGRSQWGSAVDGDPVFPLVALRRA
jgi:ubiquinone/menaquinone biosynthesis C-methylase UbiE